MIIFGKEVLMGFIGLGVCSLLYHYDVIDNCFAIMMMIIYADPTSLQLYMMCTAHKNNVDNISKIYMVMYLTAAIPMMIWTIIFLIILF